MIGQKVYQFDNNGHCISVSGYINKIISDSLDRVTIRAEFLMNVA